MDKRRKNRGNIEDLNIPEPPAEQKPFDRLPNEGAKPYAAFNHYCQLGAERSLGRVAADLGKAPKGIRDWSARWLWRERVKHWDTHMEEIEQRAKERVRAETAEKWERRRMEAAEANWDRAQRIGLKAEAMLKNPLYTETITVTDQHGNPVAVTMEPAKWDLKTCGALMKLASELQNAALVAALGGQEDDGFDPTTATPEECRTYLEEQGLIPKALPAPGE